MYKNKFNDRNNIAGINVARIRKTLSPKCSQRALAEKLQLIGHDIDKNAVQKMESGERFINDIELKALSVVLKVGGRAAIVLPDGSLTGDGISFFTHTI